MTPVNTIAITPAEGSFGFNVKYDDEKISIPGYHCGIDFFLDDDEDEHSELRFILEEDFGCSYHQVNAVKNFILSGISGMIDEKGDAHSWHEDEETETDDEEDVEEDVEENEEKYEEVEEDEEDEEDEKYEDEDEEKTRIK